MFSIVVTDDDNDDDDDDDDDFLSLLLLLSSSSSSSPPPILTTTNFVIASSHVIVSCTRFCSNTNSLEIGTLIWDMLSRSRTVTASSSSVWKSIVIPNGMPSSSDLAYLRPTVPNNDDNNDNDNDNNNNNNST